jgi:hypothetical protein
MTTPSKPKAGLLDNKQDIKTEETCEWYINSPKHYNCFWIYVIDKSAPDGSMPELVQSEIAQLLGWSNTKTHFMLKEAMKELVEALNKFKANQLINNQDPDHFVDVSLMDIDPISNYTSDDTED